MTVSVTCYGGVNEIGGNKILIEDKGTKVFLDFGAGFSEGAQYYSSGIEPRSVNGAGDYFEFGLLPEIQGLYSEDALQNTKLKYTKPEVGGIILSHYHYDHMGRMDFVDPKIPVYCGETTDFIHQACNESTGSPLEGREVRSFRTGHKFNIGNLEVEPIHVDHSIPGAYGFIIHTSQGPIGYTGDFRFHGPMGSMTDDFVSSAAKAHPIVLITEGTRVRDTDEKQDLSESEVVKQTARILGKSNRLVFSSFRGNDTDRIVSFHKAAKATGRRLVVSMKVAMILEKLEKDKRLEVPRVGRDVLVYVRRKAGGNYDDRDYYKWERKFLNFGVTAEQVRKKQAEMFLHLDVWYFPELIDIKPERGGAYIHASTEAFNEEGEQEEDVIKNWVSFLGFAYHQIHASGHAPLAQVRTLVQNIKGKQILPIHTERPDLFASFATPGKVVLPEKGKVIRL